MNVKVVATSLRQYIDFSDIPFDSETKYFMDEDNNYFISDKEDAFNKQHLLLMICKIEDEEVSGEKAHRWIGYIQGVIVSHFGATLEEIKELNKGE